MLCDLEVSKALLGSERMHELKGMTVHISINYRMSTFIISDNGDYDEIGLTVKNRQDD